MSSLRDQLMGLGFKPAAGAANASASAGKRAPARRGKHTGKPAPAPQPTPREAGSEEMDLARAYALRAREEKAEREAAERQKQEAARARREARSKLSALLAGKALNVADAEIARHFSYGGKIKRIYVTAAQLAALNAGELGVVQEGGRYLLVDAATLAEAEAVFADAVALKVDPAAPAEDADYSDPKYQVPDDLLW